MTYLKKSEEMLSEIYNLRSNNRLSIMPHDVCSRGIGSVTALMLGFGWVCHLHVKMIHCWRGGNDT